MAENERRFVGSKEAERIRRGRLKHKLLISTDTHTHKYTYTPCSRSYAFILIVFTTTSFYPSTRAHVRIFCQALSRLYATSVGIILSTEMALQLDFQIN